MSYGIFDQSRLGFVKDTKKLSAMGDLDHRTNLCNNLYIPENEYIKALSIRYDSNGIKSLNFISQANESNNFGMDPQADDSTENVLFDADDYILYGLIGLLTSDSLAALGVIRLNNSCLADWKDTLGDKFTWYIGQEA